MLCNRREPGVWNLKPKSLFWLEVAISGNANSKEQTAKLT